MKRLLFIVFFSLSMVFCYSSESGIENEIQNSKIEKLEYKITNLEDINEKLLNTVYWTIGTFSLIVISFILVNLFAGIQTKKKEMESIEVELKKILLEHINSELSNVEKKMTESISKSNSEIEKSICEDISDIKDSISKINRKYLSFRRDYLEFTNKPEKKQGYFLLSSILEIIEIDLLYDFDYNIRESLDWLFDYIQNNKLNSDEATRILEAVKKIPEQYIVRIDRIKQTIKVE
jgi:hypothetical protein